jgi:hypothetical protein
MRVCHNVSVGFDDPNLVSHAGLVPVMVLAERAGLHDLVGTHLRVPGPAGSNPAVKVAALVAGMVAGADWPARRGCLANAERAGDWTSTSCRGRYVTRQTERSGQRRPLGHEMTGNSFQGAGRVPPGRVRPRLPLTFWPGEEAPQ